MHPRLEVLVRKGLATEIRSLSDIKPNGTWLVHTIPTGRYKAIKLEHVYPQTNGSKTVCVNVSGTSYVFAYNPYGNKISEPESQRRYPLRLGKRHLSEWVSVSEEVTDKLLYDLLQAAGKP